MFIKPLILAGIVLGITIYIEIKQFKKYGFNSMYALIGIALSLFFLTYPLYNGYKGGTRLVYSALYSLQSLFLNEDFELINTVELHTFFDYAYVGLIYALFLLAPLFTATTLLSLIGKTFSKLKLKFSIKKEYHIFSEINERTVALAEKIMKTHPSSKIIFTNKVKNENLLSKSIRILKLEDSINQLNISNIKKIKYLYYMSENEDDNLNNALEFIEQYKSKEIVYIYILNNKQEAYMLIDSLLKQQSIKNIKVEIVNETERTVYQRLNNLPINKIFLPNENTVTALIVGCGEYGQAFLKAITWCFQVIGYSLKIVIVEKNAQDAIKKINLEAPELLSRYSIDFIDKDIETVITDGDLDKYSINYAVITAGSDTNNFNISIALRRYFMLKQLTLHTYNPIIDILIRNEYKNKNISILKTEKNESYNINTFGSIIEQYQNNSIVDSDIEKMARNLHLIYNPNDKNLVDFYKYEYNKKSSRAMSVHVKYKLYSILRGKYTGDINKDLQQYNLLLKNEDVKDALAINEHDRWMAYLYTDGYRLANIHMVEQYYNRTNNHKDTLIRLHPALVNFERLKQVEIDLEHMHKELTGIDKKINLIQYDYEIVQKLNEIVGIK